jgi:hypothetical protein
MNRLTNGRAVTAFRERVGESLIRVQALRQYDGGRLAPPAPIAKRRHLLALFREGGHSVLVESGTYLGGTVAFFVPHARRIITVEIDPSLHQQAKLRFAEHPHVDLRLGDALDVVPAVVGELAEPCLLWLDGHFSGGVTGHGQVSEPAVEILGRIGAATPASGTTVVIDDLRRFGRASDAPSLEALLDAARQAFPRGRLTTGFDCLIVRS